MLNLITGYVRKQKPILTGLACCLLATGCTTVPAASDFLSKDPIISKTTKTQTALKSLAAPQNKVTVAVYGFEDKTGQFRPTEAGQTLSRAVSQGGDEILIKALQDAGKRSWFTIIERSNLNNLLKERQIITEMRQRYLGETQVNSKALPPLLFAGVLFEGGIVGFDTNTLTGGVAARYLGVGGQTDYRQSVVTVHLRAVSVKTGEVLASVTTEKTIASVGLAVNAFRFVTFDNLLEADTGVTSNEPGLLALRQAIEKAVYALIMEGTEIGLWGFQDKIAETALMNDYRLERDGTYTLTADENSFATTPVAPAPETKKTAAAQQKYRAIPVAANTVGQITSKQIDSSRKIQAAKKVVIEAKNDVQTVDVKHRPALSASNMSPRVYGAPDAEARARALAQHLQSLANKEQQTAALP